MTVLITFGYDDQGKFSSSITGNNVQQVLDATKDFQTELIKRVFDPLAAVPANQQTASFGADDEGPTPVVEDPEEQ